MIRGVSWPVVAAVASLAGLDLVGSLLAKEYALRPRWALLAGGVLTFGIVFVLYAKSLAIGELWVVTFGWIVLLQVGVLVLDRFRFGTAISPLRLVLAVALVGAQVALLATSQAANAGG